MVKIMIPTALKQYTEGSKTLVNVNAKSVSDAMSILLKENKKLATHIVDEQGNLRNFVNLFVNNEDIRNLQGQNTKVGEEDMIRIVPAIAGGSDSLKRKPIIPDIDDRKIQITPREYRRYGRHLIIPEVGMEGQRRLKAGKVLSHRHRRSGFSKFPVSRCRRRGDDRTN